LRRLIYENVLYQVWERGLVADLKPLLLTTTSDRDTRGVRARWSERRESSGAAETKHAHRGVMFQFRAFALFNLVYECCLDFSGVYTDSSSTVLS